MAVLWTSKMNIKNYDIYEEGKLKDILRLISSKIRTGLEYTQIIPYIDENEEEKTYSINYQFSTIQHLGENYNDAICGYLVKNSKIFANKVEILTGETTKSAIDNDEKSIFYFDVKKELICFCETRRFSYKLFNEAFAGVINEILKEFDYECEFSLYSKSLNLDEIRTELKSFGKIKEISVRIIPPNLGDDLLDKIKQNGMEDLERYKRAAISGKETKLLSNNVNGLNLDSEILNETLQEIEELNSCIDNETALKNGYLKIEALHKDGRKMASEELNPLKKIINDRDKIIAKFKDIAKDFLSFF